MFFSAEGAGYWTFKVLKDGDQRAGVHVCFFLLRVRVTGLSRCSRMVIRGPIHHGNVSVIRGGHEPDDVSVFDVWRISQTDTSFGISVGD